MRTPAGYERIEAGWWPMVADSLAKPWPREAVLFDLRWWAGRVKMGEGKMPGRPALARRYGWTDWAVKAALRSEHEWRDPFAASPPPADRQPAASGDTDKRRISRKYRQPTASPPPADRHAREPLSAHGTPIHPKCDPPVDRGDDTPAPAPPPEAAPAPPAPPPPSAPAPKRRRPRDAWPDVLTPEDTRIRRVWEAHRQHRPATGPHPGSERGSVLACIRRVQQLEGVDPDEAAATLAAVVEWTHTAPDSWWRRTGGGALAASVVFKVKSVEQRLSALRTPPTATPTSRPAGGPPRTPEPGVFTAWLGPGDDDHAHDEGDQLGVRDSGSRLRERGPDDARAGPALCRGLAGVPG